MSLLRANALVAAKKENEGAQGNNTAPANDSKKVSEERINGLFRHINKTLQAFYEGVNPLLGTPNNRYTNIPNTLPDGDLAKRIAVESTYIITSLNKLKRLINAKSDTKPHGTNYEFNPEPRGFGPLPPSDNPEPNNPIIPDPGPEPSKPVPGPLPPSDNPEPNPGPNPGPVQLNRFRDAVNQVRQQINEAGGVNELGSATIEMYNEVKRSYGRLQELVARSNTLGRSAAWTTTSTQTQLADLG
jgi:hypothetical protein